MRKKSIGAVLGVMVLVIGGFIIFNSTRGGEEVTQNTGQQVGSADKKLKEGSFLDLDAVHKGSGKAVVYETANGPALRLENFSVTNGPDLYVYLSKNRNIAQDKQNGEFVSLGKLQKTTGEQTYTLPPNYQEFAGVSIYCRAFTVPFSVAAFT